MDDILKSDHSNGSYSTVISCGAVHHTMQGEFVESVDGILSAAITNQKHCFHKSSYCIKKKTQKNSVSGLSE